MVKKDSIKGSCYQMNVIKESPVLQSLTRTGKKKFWQACAFVNDEGVFYQKRWWQEGSKVQSTTPVRVGGKNVGRSNETLPTAQAISELDSIVKKQRDKGYSEDGSQDHIPIKPMLAHKYKGKEHKVEFPCFVQPKLDGFRMLKKANGHRAWTRGGKEHVQECVSHLMWDTYRYMVDGELILPHMPPLQETSRAAKKFRPDVSPTLIYAVYDIVEPDISFGERSAILSRLVESAPSNVHFVETVKVENEQELFEAHARFTSQGYEGTIVRSGSDGYNIGYRSNSLLKMKDFQDAEFKIVSYTDGKGSFEGKMIFICETSNGNTFNVTPEGTMDYRKELWNNRKEYVGRWLTVRFQTLSEDQIPIFPIGVDVRDVGEF